MKTYWATACQTMHNIKETVASFIKSTLICFEEIKDNYEWIKHYNHTFFTNDKYNNNE
jgi:hypothetical protein